MDAHYYEADLPANAFAKAAKDTTKWDRPTMEAFDKMAERLREGFQPTKSGLGNSCFCESGHFRFYFDTKRGIGISVVALQGRESGIENSAAQEILDFHRDRLDQPLFAIQLLDWSSHIGSLAELDQGYALLLKAHLIEQTDTEVTVEVDGKHLQRPLYLVRSRKS